MSDQEQNKEPKAAKAVKKDITNMTPQEMEAETKRLELIIKQQEFEELTLRRQEREFSLKDLKQRVEERELKEKQLQNNRASQGATFSQQEQIDKNRWGACTHKKGGVATTRDVRVLSTGGNSTQYAVIKHQFINGDIWVRCLRCAKTWKPPVEQDFYFRNGVVVAPKDGKFDTEAFEKASSEYMRALQFETGNSMSGSIQCRFTRLNPVTHRVEDAADIYRDNVRTSNLR